jgi:Zn finger protein HypA/HybF involved in hydrogenase expression
MHRMHEMSIAHEVCRITEAHVGADQLPHVVEVGLEVGDQAGVEVGNLEFCLEVLLSSPPFGHGRPAITRLAGNDLRLSYVEIDDGNPDD